MKIGKINQQPFYDPWIGGEYANRKRRIAAGEQFSGMNWFLHIMGESHYADPNDHCRDLTKQVVCKLAMPGGSKAVFFNRVLQAAQGCEYTDVNSSGWSDVAFSNYIQSLLPATAIMSLTTQNSMVGDSRQGGADWTLVAPLKVGMKISLSHFWAGVSKVCLSAELPPALPSDNERHHLVS